jgi:hypothetical protein
MVANDNCDWTPRSEAAGTAEAVVLRDRAARCPASNIADDLSLLALIHAGLTSRTQIIDAPQTKIFHVPQVAPPVRRYPGNTSKSCS